MLSNATYRTLRLAAAALVTLIILGIFALVLVLSNVSKTEASLETICAKFDTDGSGYLSAAEVFAAKKAHSSGRSTYQEWLAVIDCYSQFISLPTPAPADTAASPTPTDTPIPPVPTALPIPPTPTSVPPTPTPTRIPGEPEEYAAFRDKIPAPGGSALLTFNCTVVAYSPETFDTSPKKVDTFDNGFSHEAYAEVKVTKTTILPAANLPNFYCLEGTAVSRATPGATSNSWSSTILETRHEYKSLDMSQLAEAIDTEDPAKVAKLFREAPATSVEAHPYDCSTPCEGGRIYNTRQVIYPLYGNGQHLGFLSRKAFYVKGKHSFTVGGNSETVNTEVRWEAGKPTGLSREVLLGAMLLELKELLTAEQYQIIKPEGTGGPGHPTNRPATIAATPTPTPRPVPTATPTPIPRPAIVPVYVPPTPTPTSVPRRDPCAPRGPGGDGGDHTMRPDGVISQDGSEVQQAPTATPEGAAAIHNPPGPCSPPRIVPTLPPIPTFNVQPPTPTPRPHYGGGSDDD